MNNTQNQIMLLREVKIEPTKEAIKKSLEGNTFNIYDKIVNIVSHEFNLMYEWRFYKDGKAWLCKITYKKKTILWLSAWEGFIKTSFYFTEKTRDGVLCLNISSDIKNEFEKVEIRGKLIALILDISQEAQLADFREIVSYKKSIK